MNRGVERLICACTLPALDHSQTSFLAVQKAFCQHAQLHPAYFPCMVRIIRNHRIWLLILENQWQQFKTKQKNIMATIKKHNK